MRAILYYLSLVVLLSSCSQQSNTINIRSNSSTPAVPLAEFEQRWQAQNIESGNHFPVPYIQTHLTSNVTGIQTLQIDATPRNTNEKFMMLSFWSQTLTSLFNLTDGDTVSNLFHKLGVGPNVTFATDQAHLVFAGYSLSRTRTGETYVLRCQKEVAP